MRICWICGKPDRRGKVAIRVDGNPVHVHPACGKREGHIEAESAEDTATRLGRDRLPLSLKALGRVLILDCAYSDVVMTASLHVGRKLSMIAFYRHFAADSQPTTSGSPGREQWFCCGGNLWLIKPSEAPLISAWLTAFHGGAA